MNQLNLKYASFLAVQLLTRLDIIIVVIIIIIMPFLANSHFAAGPFGLWVVVAIAR